MWKPTLLGRTTALLFLAAGLSISAGPNAQTFPDRPVRIIVAYPPGGGLDIIGRLIAASLSQELGQSVLVENRAGAAGIVGTEYAARAQPDGHTLVLSSNALLGIGPSLYKNLPFDSIKDFAPISLVATITNVLVVHPSVPAKTVGELIDLAKAKPNALNYGSGGNGSTPHIGMELFKMMAQVQIVHVPYKGLGPAVADLLAGHTQVMMSNAPPVLPHVKSGKLRALGVSSVKRIKALPELPTISEAGVAGFEADGWYGVLAPAGTPTAVVRRLHGAFATVLRKPEIDAKLSEMGTQAVSNTPEELATLIKSDIVKWAKVIKESGARVD